MFLLYAALSLGVLATHTDGGTRFFGWSVPNICFVKKLFGFDCPGCGITRSIVHVVHLDWAGAFALHPAGPMIGALLFLQLGYFGLTLCGKGKIPVPWKTELFFFSLADQFLTVALMAGWIIKLTTK